MCEASIQSRNLGGALLETRMMHESIAFPDSQFFLPAYRFRQKAPAASFGLRDEQGLRDVRIPAHFISASYKTDFPLVPSKFTMALVPTS
jgi:hypothetical protein